MGRNSAIILGGGLGGLECGFILAKNGVDVTVLERSGSVGGCLRSFSRGGDVFETGFHYTGGLDPDGPLHPFFRYFGLLGLPWVQLDPECFDEVCIGGESFPFACGHARFAERLSERFPHEKDGIARFTALLKETGDRIFEAFRPGGSEFAASLFSRSAREFTESCVSDALLRKVLAGTILKMDACGDSLPLYEFAQINDSFIRSAWRLRGGGSQIAESLAQSVRAFGGRVLCGAEAVSVRVSGGRVSGVTLAGGETLNADFVISSLHPAVTLGLLGDSGCVRKVYRDRISSLANTAGMFTAGIKLKPGAMRSLNRNIYVHSADADPWSAFQGGTDSVLVSFGGPAAGSDEASVLDILAPMHWNEVGRWADLPSGRRAAGYAAFKQAKAESCIALVRSRLPELGDAVDTVYTSTPLTWRDYVRSPEGSAYGIRKDCRDALSTVLSTKTPVPNLFLAGQSVNLHGLLGVSMTSVFACAQILGMETVRRNIFG